MAIKEEIGLKIEEMREQGFNLREIEKVLKVSESTIKRYLKGDVKIIFNNEGSKEGQKGVRIDLNDNKAYLNSQLQTFKEQIRQELDNLKGEITQFIRDEAPLKADLDIVRQENKSIKGKLEFIKKVLKKININAYNKVIEGFK